MENVEIQIKLEWIKQEKKKPKKDFSIATEIN
jgi:hypothetical protein